jgi:hypothetical protein
MQRTKEGRSPDVVPADGPFPWARRPAWARQTRPSSKLPEVSFARTSRIRMHFHRSSSATATLPFDSSFPRADPAVAVITRFRRGRSEAPRRNPTAAGCRCSRRHATDPLSGNCHANNPWRDIGASIPRGCLAYCNGLLELTYRDSNLTRRSSLPH